MRFHLDEHVDHAVAHGLRQRGIDVTTTTDAGLLGASDEQHLEYALDSVRVIFTQDADFLRLHQRGLRHGGIIYATPGSRDVGEVVRFLCLLNDCVNENELQGVVEFL